MGAGIDYGMGTSNIDTETGIRYGVIPSHEVLQAWADSSEPYYADDADEDAEPLGFIYEDADYAIQQGGDDCDLFVMRSKYYTLCRYCSPCAPGAGFLLDEDEDGIKAYALGPDFFDEGQAPYTLYLVADGTKVD